MLALIRRVVSLKKPIYALNDVIRLRCQRSELVKIMVVWALTLPLIDEFQNNLAQMLTKLKGSAPKHLLKYILLQSLKTEYVVSIWNVCR